MADESEIVDILEESEIPDMSEETEMPDVASEPGSPDIPAESGMPDVASEPGSPDMPAESRLPDVRAQPELSQMPKAPEIPAKRTSNRGRQKGASHTKHLQTDQRQRVRTLFFDGGLTKEAIRQVTGYTPAQIRRAIAADSAAPKPRSGRPPTRPGKIAKAAKAKATNAAKPAEGT